MSVRRRTRTSPRPRGRLDRRTRSVVAAGAAVALLGTAALIGSGADRDADRSATQASGSGNSSASDGGSAGSAGVSGRSRYDASSTTVASSGKNDEQADGGGGDGSSGGGGSAAPRLAAGAPVDAKIIRTGSVEVALAKGKFDAASTRLNAIATGAAGFVSASETSALDDQPRGSFTLRVPAASFDTVLGQVGKIGDVQAVNTGSQDVTGEYTDVASRLKALQAEREQINLVLSRAETIPDILSVRDRLSVVQGEIEQLQGRQKVLDDQTSLSTLTVSLYEKGSPASVDTAPPVERSGFSKLGHDAADRFTDGGRSIALGLATMAPWLLLGLVLFVPTRALWRRTAPADGHHPTPPDGPPAATTAD